VKVAVICLLANLNLPAAVEMGIWVPTWCDSMMYQTIGNIVQAALETMKRESGG
jgi:hypothetical protein